ncbi:MAG: hypothetical protein DRJ60_00250 [Thermoprotei archaeon]|nr:MAG: hypothetical protein DRJ60_00250 [Thermoprotei archaeon]
MSNMNTHIIAERVAEVVNRKLAEIHKRIDALESKVAKLELDVNTLRVQTIESIVKSVLTIKIEDLASAIAVRVSSGFSDAAKEVVRVAEELRSATSDIKVAASELRELKALPEKVVEAAKSAKPPVQLDLSKIKATISGAVSKSMKGVEELTSRVATLEKQVSELSANLGKLGESLAVLTATVSRLENLRKTVEEMRESVDYSREVLGILEERLKGRPSEEEEEES